MEENISSLIMELMREKNIMRDKKCREEKSHLGEFFSEGTKKTAKTGKEFGKEGKKACFFFIFLLPFCMKAKG